MKLKPCPLCGGEAVLCDTGRKYYRNRTGYITGRDFHVFCLECRVETKRVPDKEHAIALWNKRNEGGKA